jgi:pilus assembly protein CpaF
MKRQQELDLETQITNKILAKLYLDSAVSDHPQREQLMGITDQHFAIERHTAPEMRHLIVERGRVGQDLGSALRSRVLEELVALDEGFQAEARERIEAQFNAVLSDENVELADEERQRLLDSIVTDLLGFGPLAELLLDDTVAEILVDGPHKIYIERSGVGLESVHGQFRDDEHLMGHIRRILAPVGRHVNECTPMVDTRLPDGSRVNIVIPPISLLGPVMTIRKFTPNPLTSEDLMRFGAWSEDIVQFLRACVLGRLNIVVAGGIGAGKTTVLSIIAGMIPHDERIIALQNADELRGLSHERVVKLETRPANLEGKGAVTMGDLITNAVRMRPDRLIVGEVFGAEALDALRAINLGHDGSMLSVHATSPRDVLTRLETMVLLANPSLPLLTIRQQIASAIDLITYQEQLRDGKRKMLHVTEVLGLKGDAIELADIFVFEQTGVKEGQVTGRFCATGVIPSFLSRLQESPGVDVPVSLFEPS